MTMLDWWKGAVALGPRLGEPVHVAGGPVSRTASIGWVWSVPDTSILSDGAWAGTDDLQPYREEGLFAEYMADIAMSADGLTMAVVARSQNNWKSIVWIYSRPGRGYLWTLAGSFKCPTYDMFYRCAISPSGTRVFVSAPDVDGLDGTYKAGLIYVLEQVGEQWLLAATVGQQDPREKDGLGRGGVACWGEDGGTLVATLSDRNNDDRWNLATFSEADGWREVARTTFPEWDEPITFSSGDVSYPPWDALSEQIYLSNVRCSAKGETLVIAASHGLTHEGAVTDGIRYSCGLVVVLDSQSLETNQVIHSFAGGVDGADQFGMYPCVSADGDRFACLRKEPTTTDWYGCVFDKGQDGLFSQTALVPLHIPQDPNVAPADFEGISFCLSPDGRTMAAGRSGIVRIWRETQAGVWEAGELLMMGYAGGWEQNLRLTAEGRTIIWGTPWDSYAGDWAGYGTFVDLG